jgi:hypothetical protein
VGANKYHENKFIFLFFQFLHKQIVIKLEICMISHKKIQFLEKKKLQGVDTISTCGKTAN